MIEKLNIFWQSINHTNSSEEDEIATTQKLIDELNWKNIMKISEWVFWVKTRWDFRIIVNSKGEELIDWKFDEIFVDQEWKNIYLLKWDIKVSINVDKLT